MLLVVGTGVEEGVADSAIAEEELEATSVLEGEGDCALTEPKECDNRTTREKSVRMRTADAEQQRMTGWV